MGFIPKKKDDETKVFTPLTDPAFRAASLSPMTIEERRKWEVMFARFHQPHSEITTQIQAFALPPGGEAGDALTTDGKNHYYWAHGGCYWLKAGANLYHATGNIAVGDVPNNANTIYAKGNILVQATDAQPYIKISNASDTERDPVYKFAVGATPSVKFTVGARDSDFDNLLWCNEDGLSDSSTAGGGWTDHLFITDVGNSRVKDHSAANLTYVGQKAISGAKYICADNLYYYVTLYGTHKVSKYLISDNSLIWTIGTTAGSGDDQFNSPAGICTDYTYLYICDLVNCRIKKHLCSTGAYVAKVGSYGTGLGQFLTPTAICTDGTWLYITEGAPGSVPLLKKHLCSDLTGVAQITADGHIDIANLQGICTDRSSLFLANTNNGDISAIFKYTRNLTFVSEYGAVGSGDTQFNQPIGIATDETYLYIVDSANSRVKKHNCSDYAYVAKVGTFGSGDSQFSGPIGICINLVGQGPEERTGRLLRLHQDGSHFDIFTKLDAYKELWFHEDSVARAEYISIKAPATVVSYELTLPGADAVGALYSNGAGALSWQTLVPLNAKFIVQEANATLTAEQSLGALATGILKNTTTAGVGVLSIAVGADLPAHEHDSAYISIIAAPAANHFPYQTAGGELIDSTYDAASFELALGNPGVDDYVLSSKIDGTRAWIAAGGALALDDLTDVDLTGLADNNIIRYDSVSGNWLAEALPAAANHDLMSATHADTTAAAVVRGDIITAQGASPTWKALAAGTAGYVLTMGANEPAWAANAAGAPTAAKYIVGLAHADLSAEKVKPQLYNNYDIDDTPAAPNALDDEFDDSSLDVKWTIANDPAGANALTETAYPGYVWVGLTEAGSNTELYQTAPAGNAVATYVAKVSIAAQGLATEIGEWASVEVYLGDSVNAQYIGSAIQINNASGDTWGLRAQGLNDGGAMSTPQLQIISPAGFVYIKLEKSTNAAYTSANTYNAYYSLNGITWWQVGTHAKTFTGACNRVGIRFTHPKSQAGTPTGTAIVDFFRRTV